MDYIAKKLTEQLRIAIALNNSKDIIQYSNVYIQYKLTLCLGILLNHNPKENEKIIDLKLLYRPSLGVINMLCHQLNTKFDYITDWTELKKIFETYINLRNNSGVGHGFDFSSDNQEQLKLYASLIDQLNNPRFTISKKFNIIHVTKIDLHNNIGINYSSDGSIYPWKCPRNEKLLFEEDCTYINSIGNLFSKYILNTTIYIKISPILKIFSENFYLFQAIHEPLTGSIKYNNIFKTEQRNFKYKEFEKFGLINEIENQCKEVSNTSGIIRNKYIKNYTNYISISKENCFHKQILDFLKSNSNAICTVWGHGGVGKTAEIQEICDSIFFNEEKDLVRRKLYFNYIVFLSAKDRNYNIITGDIDQNNKDVINDFKSLIIKINEIIFNENRFDESLLLDDFNGKALIIIDDFETFNFDERDKIISFTDKLDVNKHKIIITSRLATPIGKEIEKKELNEDETLNFLTDILINQIPQFVDSFNLNKKETREKIYKVTSGRPLFIYHLSHLIMQNQDIEDVLTIDIKNTKAAIEFLYGRFYNYLNDNAKIIFKILGLIVSKTDLLCRTKNLQYLSELNNDSFEKSLQHLEKLRIVSVSETRDFLTVYSPEILTIMEKKIKDDEILHEKISSKFKSDSYLLLGSNKTIFNQKMDGLEIKSKIEKKPHIVIDAYELLIKDNSFSIDERLLAFNKLINYLLNKNIDVEYALELCNEYSLYFKNDSKFINIYFQTLIRAGKFAEALTLSGNYLKSAIGVECSSDYFIIAGKHLEYISKALISRKEDLNDKQKELIDTEYHTMAHSIKTDMIALIEIAKKIFLTLVSVSCSSLDRKNKQAISQGLSVFLKMMRRTLYDDKHTINQERNEVFYAILNYGITHFDGELSRNLINLKYQVENDLEDKKVSNVKGDHKTETEFGKLLKEALQAKK